MVSPKGWKRPNEIWAFSIYLAIFGEFNINYRLILNDYRNCKSLTTHLSCDNIFTSGGSLANTIQ